VGGKGSRGEGKGNVTATSIWSIAGERRGKISKGDVDFSVALGMSLTWVEWWGGSVGNGRPVSGSFPAPADLQIR